MSKKVVVEKMGYSLDEAVVYTGLSHNTLRKYHQEGTLRGRKVGSRWVFSKRALDEFLGDEQRNETPSSGAA